MNETFLQLLLICLLLWQYGNTQTTSVTTPTTVSQPSTVGLNDTIVDENGNVNGTRPHRHEK